MKYILMDIEGTTTSISFVHDTLFPYAKERIRSYINTHLNEDSILKVLSQTKETVKDEEQKIINDDEAISQLIKWIDLDRKHPALKTLQGFIWAEGYLSGEIKGHVYQDVPEALANWKQNGLMLGIYSSGSIGAQKSLFGHSLYGDLNSYFSHYFDTSIGHKRDEKSYKNIQTELGIDANEILFLSDISEELDAAKAVGFKTMQLIRLGDVPYAGHTQVKNFKEINF